MKNTARLLGLVALGLVVSGCSGAGEDAANVEEPLLAWRLPGAVDGRTVLVTVDALTGGILEVRPIGSGAVEAYSAERFYASGTDANGAPLGRRDPRHRPDARLPVDVARPPLPFLPQASLWSVTSGLVISVQDKLGVPVLATHIQDELYQPVDFLPSAALRRIPSAFVAILRCVLTYKSRFRALLGSRLGVRARTSNGLGPKNQQASMRPMSATTRSSPTVSA